MCKHIRKSGALVTLLFAGLLLFPTSGNSGDPDGKYSNVNPDVKAWIKGLSSELTPESTCCDIADGHPPEAVWMMAKDKYRVQIGENWYDVPPEAVITEPNKLGRAIVWYSFESGPRGHDVRIRCFLPGMMS